MPSDEISLDLIKHALSSLLDIPEDSLRFNRCSTGKYNTSYFVEGGAEALILRIAPEDRREFNLFYEYRMMRQEPRLHKILRERTKVPVPEIVACDFACEFLNRDFLVMKRVPGVPISEHPGLGRREFARILEEVGDSLRQVHAIQADRYGYLGEHRPMEPQESWTEAFVIMWNKLLDDIQGSGGYSRHEADSMRRLLDSNIRLFNRRTPASLLHMDVWAQNIMADSQGRMTGLIDWDRALWGDPEIEFAVLDYCGISEEPFWEGYGERRATDSEASRRNVFYLLYELQKYIFIRRIRGGNPVLADSYRRQSLELARRIGLKL
jgi:aminoglycoside phosphotransferase (APT) family kinase protein